MASDLTKETLPVKQSTLSLLLPFVAGVLATMVGTYATVHNSDRSLEVKLVEIAVGILLADPTKSDVNPAREWATDTIEKYSQVKFKPKDKADLLKHNLSADLPVWKSSGSSTDLFKIPLIKPNPAQAQ